LFLKSASKSQLPSKINWGTLVGMLPSIMPKAKLKMPNKKMVL
jgi:hypothetical protein